MEQIRVAILYRGTAAPHDAILSYSERLAAELRAGGSVDATVLRLESREYWSQGSKRDSDSGLPLGFDAYLLQYNPFSYGRWGVAPWLPLAWQRIRRRGMARMVVTVHEAYVPAIGWRDTLMGLWQRAQLYSLLLSSDAVIATCSERKEQVRALRLSTPLSHVPVGSNLDDITDVTGCAELRVQLRGTRIRPVVATFGNDHPSRLLSLLDRALSSLAETLGDFVVLNLGASAPHLRAPAGVEVIRPGPLTSQELSLHLACADLVLLPFSKGAITNKTALMAALQLGRPVLSTRGLCTDHVLLDPGLRLVDVGDADGYAAEAVALMRDQAQRDALGEHGRALYQRAFSWQVIAKQTLQALGLSGAKAFDSSTVGGEVPLDDRIP